jgi:hypothetical protein
VTELLPDRPLAEEALRIYRSRAYQEVVGRLREKAVHRLLKTSAIEAELLQSAKHDLETIERFDAEMAKLAEEISR